MIHSIDLLQCHNIAYLILEVYVNKTDYTVPGYQRWAGG